MTTIVLVRKNNEVVVAGDGQVSMGILLLKVLLQKLEKLKKEMWLQVLLDQQLMHLHCLKD